MPVTAPPAPAIAPSPPPSGHAAPPAAALPREDRILIRNVSWQTYEALLEAVGDGLPRLTYDDGLLEIQMPSPQDDAFSLLMGYFIAAYCEEFALPYKPTGSTTWRREKKRGGLEADQSFYIQSYEAVRGRFTWTLEETPPPDLAVEIDLSPPVVEKTSIYTRLGVPEVWRWRDGRLVVMVLEGGTYKERERSVALPEFPMDRLRAALNAYPDVEVDEAVRRFRRWCRERAELGHAVE